MPDVTGAALPLPLAEVEHRLPGRIRLRVRGRRGDAGFFRRVEAALARVPGVHGAWVNPQTGSVLVEHGGDETELLAAAREQGLFTAAPPLRSLAVSDTPSRLPRGAVASSTLDLAAFGLAGAGLLQLARGEVLGSASENLWNAYGLYAITRRTAPSALLVAFGLWQIARGEVLGSATSLFLYAYGARRLARHQSVEEAI